VKKQKVFVKYCEKKVIFVMISQENYNVNFKVNKYNFLN